MDFMMAIISLIQPVIFFLELQLRELAEATKTLKDSLNFKDQELIKKDQAGMKMMEEVRGKYIMNNFQRNLLPLDQFAKKQDQKC